jgi:uncharacterized repeat protein (TIGR01451 family)
MPSKRHRKQAQRSRRPQQSSPRATIALQANEAVIPAPAERTGTGKMTRRGVLFAVVCALCVLIAGAAITWAVIRDGSGTSQAAGGPMDDTGAPGMVASVSQPSGAVMFRSLLPGDHWNQAGLVPIGHESGGRSMVPLRCLRIHFDGGRGLCLAESNGPAGSFAAYILDADLRETGEVKLGGLPSRTRVSPDARYGATTSFVSGHSYAEDGFSTETLLIDLDAGEELANLEEFSTFRNGEEFANEDFNYWGVTFLQDSNLFYATLSTAGETYLVRGDIEARRLDVIRDNVECPSISPDNTRIAFKKKVGGDIAGPVWRFHVLDLETMTETPLAETRSIDDQIMWLDNEQVLYGVESDTWIMPADGSGTPRRYMAMATSPVVVRGTGDASGAEAAVSSTTDADDESDVLTLPETDLGVTVDIPEQIVAGVEMTYKVTVTNHGPTDASMLVLDHSLPDGMTFGSVTAVEPEGVAYGCGTFPEENRIRCDTLSLASGGRWTIAVTVTPDATGTRSAWSSVGAAENDPNPENDQANTELIVGP